MSLKFSETVTGSVTDGVLVITIDNPPVNAASAEMRQGLFAAIDHAAATDEITGIVMTGAGKFVEIQGTAEQVPFSREELNSLMALAEQGIGELTLLQQAALAS